MILLSLGLLAFGITDLVRWQPVKVHRRRAALAVLAGAGSSAAVAALSGISSGGSYLIAATAALILAIWVAMDYLENRPAWGIIWMASILLTCFAASGSVDPIGGSLSDWYEQLGFPFVRAVAVDQFVLAASAGLFLLCTTNRVVRLTLDAAVPGWKRGEQTLKGGRLLGPLERIVIVAILLAGDPSAAAIVIAAKGLLRFPEIKGDDKLGPDAVTEYFLIGTLTSLLIAALTAVLILGAG